MRLRGSGTTAARTVATSRVLTPMAFATCYAEAASRGVLWSGTGLLLRPDFGHDLRPEGVGRP